MEIRLWLFAVLLVNVVPFCNSEGEDLTIGSFNMQIFGRAKISKPAVVDVLVKIITRYHIILLQEIRDSTETAIVQLLDKVNRAGDHQYGMTISERLGRTSSKEQYAYFYRLGVGISVLDTYQYPDPGDVFEREPYAVLFSVSSADVAEFVLVGIHTSPDDAVVEINNLKNVYEDVKKKWKNKNILIMGDFNADCTYVTKTEMKTLVLHDPIFHWWITDEVDTTVSKTDCTYDRFVMTGTMFIASVVHNSAKVFNFDTEYGLGMEEAKKVSDHYPIEIAVKAQVGVTSKATGSGLYGGGILQNMVLKKLSIASFNVRVFGRTKVSKTAVLKVLVKTIRRYEIILIQEIRDISGTAMWKLLDSVNREGSPQYGMKISDRLGKTTSKEQYAFLYKLGVGIQALDTHHYPDPGDLYEREPFSVLFSVANAVVPQFVLSALHTSPSTAFEEINQLPVVHEDLLKLWSNNNILILGDLNADCNYVTKSEMQLLSQQQFHWWIPNDVDTTVTRTNCAYDRFLMSGEDFINNVIKYSSKVFHFDKAYGLDELAALSVSDHYPIEISIKLQPPTDGPQDIGTSGHDRLKSEL